MADTKRPIKSSEEILKEMEEMSKGISASDSSASAQPKSEGGGALKSLLGFFVKVHDPDEETRQAAQSPPKGAPSAPAKGMPPGKGGAPLPDPAAPRRVGDLVANEPAPKFAQPKAPQGTDLSSKPFEEI